MSEIVSTAEKSETEALRRRVAELEARLASVTAERDKIRRAYEQLKEQLELLRRRIYVAKAEHVDAHQLELEFAEKKAALEKPRSSESRSLKMTTKRTSLVGSPKAGETLVRSQSPKSASRFSMRLWKVNPNESALKRATDSPIAAVVRYVWSSHEQLTSRPTKPPANRRS